MKLWISLVVGLTGLAGPAHAAKAIPTQLPGTAEPVGYDLTITPDLKALTFAGRVAITLQVPRATDRITLNAADLAISRATLDGAAAQVSLDAADQTVTVTLARSVTAGSHVLSLDYTGKINSRPSGLFKVDYDTPAGRGAGRMLATQFEPADARRLLPSFDEPAKKATFTVAAVVPAAQMAISNMPEASSEPLPGGLKRVRFATTPKMSSYLLFFGLGDLERITADVDGTTVGVVLRRGDTEKGRFALAAATDLLRYYNGYFGAKYPLPKLDLIGAPSTTGGAMENWGAILYTQTYLVVDPRLSTEGDRQAVFSVIAHEMAHQWFGDLVTMAWWNDLWLNEAFASWMASKASDHFHPEWSPLLQALGDKERALQLDARSSTHPISREVKTVAQAEQAFDAITYQKGEAVLRMLESYAGEDAWRSGVRAYMAAHAYGNTVGDDLWGAMDAAAGRPISPVAHDFTLQPGVPLVRAIGSCSGRADSGVFLQVDRFQASGPSTPFDWMNVKVGPQPGGSALWRVPVRAALSDGTGVIEGVAPQTAGLGFKGCAPSVINHGQTSYARVAYAPEHLAVLTKQMVRMSPADQIGLVNDSLALGLAGYQPMAPFLDLAATVPTEADPVVWSATIARLAQVNAAYAPGPKRDAYRAWVNARLRPVQARVGFDARPGEAANVAVLRQDLLRALVITGEPGVIAEARRRFETFRRDPASLSAASRRWVLAAVARNADAATWEVLHQMARAARDPLEKQRLYEALASVSDPALAERVMELALTNEPPANMGPGLIMANAGEHPDLAWRFVLSHQAELARDLDALERTTFVPRVAGVSTDARRADELIAFAEKTIPADARGEVDVAVTRIRQSAEIVAKRLPEVDAWVAGRPTRGG